MNFQVTDAHWRALQRDGHLAVPGACLDDLSSLREAVDGVKRRYPYGFADPKFYSGQWPAALTAETARKDGRILIPHIGFLDPRILAPLANPALHGFIERIVGKDFYLSNTWYQEVAPGTGRLGYHKDPRGNITFNIMIDDALAGMGCTCVVPGTHVNTPPPSYCMDDIFQPHPNEVDISGKAGDLVFFSTETWHARSRNTSSATSRRLFYNFFSRSSRETTAWDGLIDESQLAAVRAVLPERFHHMLHIDRPRSRALAAVSGPGLERWARSTSTSDMLARDFVHGALNYGRPVENPAQPGYLMPYTTRLVETTPWSATTYLSHMKAVPTAKNFYVGLRSAVGRVVKPAHIAPHTAKAEA